VYCIDLVADKWWLETSAVSIIGNFTANGTVIDLDCDEETLDIAVLSMTCHAGSYSP